MAVKTRRTAKTGTTKTRRGRSAVAAGRDGSGKTKPVRDARVRAPKQHYSGAEGIRKAEEERKRVKAQGEARKLQWGQPFRFWMPPDSERRIVVLDEEPSFFRYEHALPDPQGKSKRNDFYVPCIDENDTCPACEQFPDHRPYYAMYLSVIDLEGFTTRAGEDVPFSRKLFIIKTGNQRKWLRQFEKEGNLRGAVFNLARDGQKDPVIGNDMDLEEFMDEAELGTYTREWKDKEGNTRTEDCSVPFEYTNIMPDLDPDGLSTMLGGGPVPGSKRAEDEALEGGVDDWADDDGDDVPARKRPRKRAGKVRPRRRR